MKNKLLTVIGLSVAVATLIGTACSAEEAAKKVIAINPWVSLSVFMNSDEGFKDAAEELGLDLEILSCIELTDTASYEMFQTALTKQPDAIVVCPWDYSAIASLYSEAQEKGIPIFDYSSDSGVDSGRITFVGTDNTTYGQIAADILNEKLGGEGKVLTMMGNLDTPNQLEQRLAFEEKCAAEYPGIETVLVDEDNGDSVIGMQKFEDDLKAHPEIDTIFCLESIGGVAAANAVEELGLEGITILAIDDNDDTVQYIKDGKIWATMAQNFYKMGYQSAVAVDAYLKGETVDITYDSGTVLITAENADNYAFD